MRWLTAAKQKFDALAVDSFQRQGKKRLFQALNLLEISLLKRLISYGHQTTLKMASVLLKHISKRLSSNLLLLMLVLKMCATKANERKNLYFCKTFFGLVLCWRRNRGSFPLVNVHPQQPVAYRMSVFLWSILQYFYLQRGWIAPSAKAFEEEKRSNLSKGSWDTLMRYTPTLNDRSKMNRFTCRCHGSFCWNTLCAFILSRQDHDDVWLWALWSALPTCHAHGYAASSNMAHVMRHPMAAPIAPRACTSRVTAGAASRISMSCGMHASPWLDPRIGMVNELELSTWPSSKFSW